MNKKEINKLMKKIDNGKKPKHWRKFINHNTTDHNIILKCGNRLFCTRCQKYFKGDVDLHRKKECELCGHKYYTYNCNVRNVEFLKDIAFYTKAEDKIILRIFEISSRYDCKTRTFKKSLQEFARFIPGIGIIINNSVHFGMWYPTIWHNVKIKRWHLYTGNKLLDEMPIYPYNKKNLFKGTPLEYAPIQEFKKEYSHYNDFKILQIASYPSFEMLWKMGLHSLALASNKFKKKGSFERRFGVPKSFFRFMVENDIDYWDYKTLKIIQKPDIEMIKQYRHYDYNYLSFMKKQGVIYNTEVVRSFYYSRDTIREICKYVPLKKLLNYQKGLNDLHLYLDYLKAADQLGFSIKSKKRLFPYQLKAWHDKLCNKLEMSKDINTQFAAYIRYLELSKYTYEDDKYIIFPAPSVEELKNEGKEQGNCVGNLYLKLYTEGETEIYFIRELEKMNKSFITLEFKNGCVKQKELSNHRTNFNKEQNDFIDKWIGYRSFMDKKAKYEKKSKIEMKQYELNKKAA